MTTPPPTISVVVPSYFKFYDWIIAAEHNAYYSDPRFEIVLSLDEPSQEEMFKEYCYHNRRRFNIRLLVNDKSHPWEPPCRAINAGLHHAEGDYVIVQSPETVVITPSRDYLFILIQTNRRHTGRFFITGVVSPLGIAEMGTYDFFQKHYHKINRRHRMDGYGFILFDREQALQLGGYDESRRHYGKDDDCIRARLKDVAGCKEVNDFAIRAVHIDRDTRPQNDGNEEPLRDWREIQKQRRKSPKVRVAWDWRKL